MTAVEEQPPAVTLRTLLAPQARGLLVVVGVLWAAGAVLGFVWQWWSPPGPAGYVVAPGAIQPDETEAFVAGDGRYAVLTVLAGVAAALIVWFGRVARGTGAVLALTVGGLGGALLTELVGGWTGGGSTSGAANTIISELPLSLHMTGLRYAQAAAALLVYGLCVSFTVADDLGRPDRLRESIRARSVGVDVQLQDARGDRDGPGGAQQGDLPPQQYSGPG